MILQAIDITAIRGSPEAERPLTGPDPTQRVPEHARPGDERPGREPNGPREVQGPGNEPDPHELADAVSGVNAYLQTSAHHIRFAVHENSDRLVAQVVDNETDEVIRTVPPEALLDLAARIDDMVGMLLDQRT